MNNNKHRQRELILLLIAALLLIGYLDKAAHQPLPAPKAQHEKRR